MFAAIEPRRRFPGIINNARARDCANATLAGWTSLPDPPVEVVLLRPCRKADVLR